VLDTILVGAAFLALLVLTNLILKWRSDAHSIPRRLRKIRSRIPMSEAAFIAGYGRPLTAEEAALVLKMRRALALAAKIEPSLFYPQDGMLDFFTEWAAEFDAVPEIVSEMGEQSLIEKYGLDLQKIKSPDFHGNMPLSEFFDSVIGASCLAEAKAEIEVTEK